MQQPLSRHAPALLQVLLSDTCSADADKPLNMRVVQLRLLAPICTACQDSNDTPTGAAEGESAPSNAEAVEAVLAVIKASEQLPQLLLSVVTECVQQIQQAESSEGRAGLLCEALPGEAPGCGELLTPAKPPQALTRCTPHSPFVTPAIAHTLWQHAVDMAEGCRCAYSRHL